MSNKRILKAYERFDYNGKVVPGSLVLRDRIPKNGKWKEIQTYQCCNYAPVYGLFDVTADWSLTTPEVIDETSFRTFLESGQDGDGNTNSLTGVVITDFSLVEGRLTCMLSATGGELHISEIEATSILSLGNIANVELISISGNPIAEMPSDVFSQYTSLIRLDINALTLPIDLSALVNLEILYASGYGYSTLNVSSLVNLKQFFGGSGNVIESPFLPTSLDFTNLSNLLGAEFSQSSALTTVNISGCTSLTGISCYYTPTLTTILGLEDCENVNYVQLNNTGFNQTALDYITVSLNDNGLSNGSLTIDNNPGTLSPTGNAARLSLISKGWSVTT